MADDCLFCKIIKGEIPSTEVYSSDRTYAFRDIDPQAPTHILLIPRDHIEDADHIEPGNSESVAALFSAARDVAIAEGLSPSLGGGGYRLVLNVGDDACNTVKHLHIHLIGGRKMTWPPG